MEGTGGFSSRFDLGECGRLRLGEGVEDGFGSVAEGGLCMWDAPRQPCLRRVRLGKAGGTAARGSFSFSIRQEEAIAHFLTLEGLSAHLKSAEHRTTAANLQFALEEAIREFQVAKDLSRLLGPV